mmetsp:Transcript_9100/g.13622  ORF Transcript_9100/g.13622 Transcript_9100/m.13622 type:complete len:137 (+) Transcript_9100:79-489(+)
MVSNILLSLFKIAVERRQGAVCFLIGYSIQNMLYFKTSCLVLALSAVLCNKIFSFDWLVEVFSKQSENQINCKKMAKRKIKKITDFVITDYKNSSNKMKISPANNISVKVLKRRSEYWNNQKSARKSDLFTLFEEN